MKQDVEPYGYLIRSTLIEEGSDSHGTWTFSPYKYEAREPTELLHGVECRAIFTSPPDIAAAYEKAAQVAEEIARDCTTGTIEHSTAWEIVRIIRSLAEGEG